MKKDKVYSLDELATELENRAKELKENGLNKEELDAVSGGGCECCGSSCRTKSESCNWDGVAKKSLACRESCIMSSPD